jgi:hypothetical protein
MGHLQEASAFLRETLPVSPDQKVFCLSLPKTGTTSLQHYLEAAGLQVAGSGVMRELATRKNVRAWAERLGRILQLSRYTGFQDQPWCFFADVYRAKFPNAKFVIFMRPFDDWFKSYRYHLADHPGPKLFATEFLGLSSPNAQEAEWRAAVGAHYARAARLTEGVSLTIGLDEPNETKCARLNAFLGLDVARFGHQLAHGRRLIFQVRRALDADIGEGRALLERYRAIYGDDASAARAARLLARASQS